MNLTNQLDIVQFKKWHTFIVNNQIKVGYTYSLLGNTIFINKLRYLQTQIKLYFPHAIIVDSLHVSTTNLRITPGEPLSYTISINDLISRIKYSKWTFRIDLSDLLTYYGDNFDTSHITLASVYQYKHYVPKHFSSRNYFESYFILCRKKLANTYTHQFEHL